MEFRVLGEVSVVVDGAVHRLRPKEQAVLAVLLGRMNAPVPSEVMIDRVWGDRPPRTVATSLRVHVDRLRGVLHRGPVSRLVTTSAGYRLVVEPDELDARRFERAVRDGTEARDPGVAAGFLRSALDEWRGEPYGRIDGIDSVAAHRAALERLRTTLLCRLAECELALGHHADVVGELTTWLAEQPTCEPLAISLSTALYRRGDQVEALAALRRFATHLVEEYGLTPSPAVAAHERALLDQDPALDHRPVTRPASPARGRTPLVGRDAEIAVLLGQLEQRPDGGTAAVTGPPGIGKSSLLQALVGSVAGSILVTGATCVADLEGRVGVPPPSNDVAQRSAGARSADEERAGLLADALLAAGCPVVAVDDPGPLDADTAVVLRHVVGLTASSILWVVASRTISPIDHPLASDPSLLAAIRIVELTPLAPTAARSLIERIGPIGEWELDRVLSRAEGNPFLLRAIGRHLEAGGAADDVPPTVSEHVRRTLGGLPDDARLLLELAAIDTPAAIDLATIGGAAGSTTTAMVAAAEAALADGVLVDGDRLGFRHAVYREALLDAMSGPRRRWAHGCLARQLLTVAPVDASRLAHHLRGSDDPELARLAADWTAIEATDAMAAGAPLTAVERFDDAVARGRAAGVDAATTIDWAIKAAEAAAWAGRLEEAQERAGRAAGLARRAGLAELFAAAAVVSVGPWLPTGAERKQAEELTVEAVEWLPRSDGPARLRLVEACVRSVVAAPGTGPIERLLGDLTDELTGAAERREHPETALLAGVGLRYLSWRSRWTVVERAELGERNARVAARTGRDGLRLEALRIRCTDWMEAAAPERLHVALDEYRAAAEEAGALLHRWWAMQLATAEATLQAEHERAAGLLAQAAELARHVDPGAVTLADLERGLSELVRTSRFDVLDVLLSGDLPDDDFDGLVSMVRLATDAQLGRAVAPAQLRAKVERLAPGPFAACLAALGSMAVSDDAPDAARHLADLLLPSSGGLCLVGSAASLGPADAYLARLLDVAGDHAAARRHRELAVSVVERAAPVWHHLLS